MIYLQDQKVCKQLCPHDPKQNQFSRMYTNTVFTGLEITKETSSKLREKLSQVVLFILLTFGHYWLGHEFCIIPKGMLSINTATLNNPETMYKLVAYNL